MKRFLVVLSLVLSGCSRGGIEPVEQASFGKEVAGFRSATSTGQLTRIYERHTKYLFEFESFAELETFLKRAEKWDPVETLCTPLSTLQKLRDTQKGEIPWMFYHAQRWKARPQHSAWAEASEMLGLLYRGEELCTAAGWNALPPYDQGQSCMVRALELGQKIPEGAGGWPLVDYYRMVSAKSAREIVLEAVRKHPREIAVYVQLGRVLENESKAERARHLKALALEAPDNYALHFTLQLRGSRAKLAGGGWDWPALKTGFEKLLEEHPNALGVRNAYAVAAVFFEDKELAAKQAALLGYHWDPDFWGSLRNYQDALGPAHDYHLGSSRLPALKLDEAIAAQTRLRYCDWQAQDLLRKGMWVSLETLLRELPQADQRFSAGQALESGDEETEGSYRLREALLRDWYSERPDSAQAQTALAGFYIAYGWLARGSGYANTVDTGNWEKLRERLDTSAKFLTAPITDQTNALTLQHHMTMLKARSFQRESADRLALAAARRGYEGVPVLQEYFVSLLPRWHGEPGDLVAACNKLRDQVGNDDAYYVMADIAVEYEGAKAVQDAKHPVHIDWSRALESYLKAQAAGRSHPTWAHTMLWDSYCCNRRAGTAALVPHLPTVDESSSNETPVCLPGAREWAEGKVDPVAWDREKFQFRLIGARRQKASPQARFGIEVRANAPLLFGTTLFMKLQTPPLTTKHDFNYEECGVVGLLMPRSDLKETLIFAPGRAEELRPGTYRVNLYVDGEVKYTTSFELTR
jgi:hypothetical protein